MEWETKRGGIRLRRAAKEGDVGAVAALLRGGAAVDAADTGRMVPGCTALIFAAARGQLECVRLLLEAGADTTLRGECEWADKKTALEWAEINGHAEVTALLRG